MKMLRGPRLHLREHVILLICEALLLTSLLPTVLGLTGPLYFTAALAMGAWLVVTSLRVVCRLPAPAGAQAGPSRAAATRLFLASVGYLPLVLFIMVIDKTFL